MVVGTSNRNFLSFPQRKHLDLIDMILIENLPCSSFSPVQSIGYEAQAKILKVNYKSGSIYIYFEVPGQIFKTLLMTHNIGKYLNSHIRGNYHYQKFLPRSL